MTNIEKRIAEIRKRIEFDKWEELAREDVPWLLSELEIALKARELALDEKEGAHRAADLAEKERDELREKLTEIEGVVFEVWFIPASDHGHTTGWPRKEWAGTDIAEARRRAQEPAQFAFREIKVRFTK